ncbi:MAG: PLP-dependent aminotransferase family protein [Planctomycetaceae bacterium]
MDKNQSMRMARKQDKKKLYEKVADRLTKMINKGTLKPGDRIPSIRQMGKQMSVAVSTVLHAYQLLEDGGLIEARPQSGYFVRPKHVRRVTQTQVPLEPEKLPLPLKVGSPKIQDVLAIADNMAGRGDTGQICAAIQAAEFLPTEAINNHLRRSVRNNPVQASQYEVGLGLKTLRERVARRAMDSGCGLGAKEIVITNGTTEALLLALRAITEPGDTVAVESPCYFGFLSLLDMLALKVVEVSTDPRTGLSIEQLEKLIQHKRVSVKTLIVNANVHNPLGSIMPDENKRRMVELMRRARLPIIEDDTYGDLAFGVQRPRCVKAFDESGNVILCSSFSKTIAPGYRIGWMAAGRWHDRVVEFKCRSSLGTAVPPQMAIASYLGTGGFDAHLRRLRRTYCDQIKLLSDAVRRHFPDGTRATKPKGGHLLWVELPEAVDTNLLHNQLGAQNIRIPPGSVFSAGGHYRNCVRLNAAVVWNKRVENAIEAIGRLAGAATGRKRERRKAAQPTKDLQ